MAHPMSHRRPPREGARPIAVAIALTLGAASASPALAQTAPPSTAGPSSPASGDAGSRAVALGREGIQLYEAGRWAEAEAKLTEAEAVLHSPVFLLYIARCRRNAGRLLDARDAYRRSVAEQLAPTAPPAWRQALVDARAELSVLEEEIARDRAKATDGPTVAPSTPVPAASPPSAQAAPPAAAPPRTGSWVPGAVVLGVGVVGLGVGAATGLVALGDSGEVDDACPDGVCPAGVPPGTHDAQLADARTMADVSTVAFIAGGVLSAAGIVLLVVRPFGGDDVDVRAGTRGVVMNGSF